ncbi:MAG: nucleoside transporter C-terminal domain-containing protein, partial [Bdellovibrionota bacterium]|nr:nucleoside transporter C-terminal domain-containing protein [Bdellovibrionota bacterium]
GLTLALNVAAMLLACIALIALCNGVLGWVGSWVGYPNITIEFLLGYLFAPVAWLLGVPWNWDECLKVGTLLGQKLVLNEFVAYTGLQKMINTPGGLSERSINISIYALCGFANFSSIAIQVGGIGSLAPDRRKEFAKLGMKCLLGGTLACLMTACIAGIMI